MNYREKAISAFCKLRRLQEANDNGYVTCVTCGKVVKWNECDGGHLVPRQHRGTEIEPDNIWPQCVLCNRFGNIDIHDYAEALVQKIGFDRVKAVEEKQHDYVKRDYRMLEKHFNAESRKIRAEKGL